MKVVKKKKIMPVSAKLTTADRIVLTIICIMSAVAGVMTSPGQTAFLPVPRFLQMAYDNRPSLSKGIIVKAARAEDLAEVFSRHEYDLGNIAQGEKPVPAIFLANLPKDLSEVESTDNKKALFIRSVLPLVLLANERIEHEREKLLTLVKRQNNGGALLPEDYEFLNALYVEYEVDAGNIAELVNRVDIIPPSLALAQAAEESGWGTSRFAQGGNALYGQQVYAPEDGIMPDARPEGRRYYVRSFDNLYGTVESYTNNLNSHKAYAQFRAMRAEMRKAGKSLDAETLVSALSKYSERGEDYVRTIQRIMRLNSLASLDNAKLRYPASDLMI